MLVMKVTSKKPKIMAAGLTNADLLSGSLDYPGYVQAEGIYALEKDRIRTTIGIVRPEKMQEIRDEMRD